MSASVPLSPQVFYSRRLLSSISASPSISPQGPLSEPRQREDNLDVNVVMVLSVLFCALIFSVGFHFLLRCIMTCTNMAASSTNVPVSTKLANTGIEKKALKSFPKVVYSTELDIPGFDTECAICLSDFTAGECVRLLPKCNHGFHVKCIDKWLSSHSSCPKCRQCLIETCEKSVGCSETPAASSLPGEVQERVVVTIVPLQPEGLVRNYRES